MQWHLLGWINRGIIKKARQDLETNIRSSDKSERTIEAKLTWVTGGTTSERDVIRLRNPTEDKRAFRRTLTSADLFPKQRTIDENVDKISQAQSGHWDQVSRTLSQGLSQVFLVVSPRVHPQGTHTICFWTASGSCFCNRCNFMVNVLYLPFATSVAVHRRPLASKEVFWANFSWEEKLESSFFPYPLRKIRYFTI